MAAFQVAGAPSKGEWFLQTHSLTPHQAFAAARARKVTARWGRVKNGKVMLRFRVDGADDLIVPAEKQAARADDLWMTTCFELFLAYADGGYREFNFSPSGEWAAYSFSGYRNRTGNFDPVQTPEIAIDKGNSVFTLTVFIDEAELQDAKHAALTAVIEEGKGRKSYWAARHSKLQPDFHEPTCFVVPVP
ncbi:MAG: DOMON-like domain-containing protein [Novosphingobium sp.]